MRLCRRTPSLTAVFLLFCSPAWFASAQAAPAPTITIGQNFIGTAAVDSTAAQTIAVTITSSANNATQTFSRTYASTDLRK